MRLFLPSAAILSLFASGGHAFAPPSSAWTSPIASRLAAGNDLSGMLSEYSTSAAEQATVTADAATAAAAAVEKVAAAAAPPPSIPPPAEIATATESGMESLAKAASAAQEAADQAAAAAAAVASKGAAATKAVAATKAAAAAGVAGGMKFQPLVKPLAGGLTAVTVKVDPNKVNADAQFDAGERARENLAVLKSNFLHGVDYFSGGVDSAKEMSGGVSTGDFSIDIESLFKIDSASISPAVAELAASLHLKEYGGWYVAAAAAIYASRQRAAGREDAEVEFEAELAGARERASEAASAAGLAARGAATAKELAVRMEKDLKKDGGSKAILESSRSKVVQMERDILENEVRALQAEVSALKQQMAASDRGKGKAVKTKRAKTEIEEEFPTKVIMESDPDEDGRIVELLKLLDEENKKKQKEAAKELEKRREEEARFVAAEKKKAASRKMTKGVEAAQAKAEVAKKRKAATKKAKKASTKSGTKAKRKTATKKAATKAIDDSVSQVESTPKKAATKKTETKAVDDMASLVESAQKKSATKKTATKAVDDWATLAESTLKRKTVAQLTEYLTRKGVGATDSSGKSLKKAELLSAVKSL